MRTLSCRPATCRPSCCDSVRLHTVAGCTLRHSGGRLQLRFGKTLRTVDKSATKGKGFSASDVSYLKVP
jgi:hypothetical protein